MLNSGDNVYYKRQAAHMWHGPARILGRDGQMYLIKHGGFHIRVHPCRLEHVKDVGTPSNEDCSRPISEKVNSNLAVEKNVVNSESQAAILIFLRW